MPEEKKKDSFTFSDKIKNSKQPGSKSFANRVSSKVGSYGKPKRTLFERTKRDAPFIIAALVALLLLPFLYKYSGQVSEEQIVAPSVEDSAFDPERYGFDTVGGDPEGQIAQLAGRDPLSLIKGFGGVEEPESYDSMASFDRSGLEDRSYSDTTEERNTTNIYKRNAPAQTRASFKRAATKIGKLSSAGLTGRGGGKLGVGMWGGGLKSAAKRVKAETPKSSPKPVSLQPLTAAGKPSRSYFGQNAAEQARRSKDAMSKANALQALADAQFKPIEPGKIGGIAGGDLGGPGGGNGNLERNFAFNGKEPWWWDMMKRRSQMEWEKKFNHKWGWIDFGVKLAQNFLDPFLSCLMTGTDDWSMGNMFGAVAGSGDEDECAGLNEKKWKVQHPGVPFGKDECREFYKYKVEEGVKDPWAGGNVAGANMGFVTQRIDCLSNGLGAKLATKWFGKENGSITEADDCARVMMDGHYKAVYSASKAKKRRIFTYVVGVPTKDIATYYSGHLQPEQQRDKLVIGLFKEGGELNLNAVNRSGFVPLFVESVAIKDRKVKKTKHTQVESVSIKEDPGPGDETDDRTDEEMADAADEDGFSETEINSWLATTEKGTKYMTYGTFLEKLRKGGAVITDSYADYNQKYGDTPETKEMQLSFSSKKGKKGKGWILGARCNYPLARISCDYYANVGVQDGETDEKGIPYAHVLFANGMADQKAYDKMKRKFVITYSVQGEDNTFSNVSSTDNTGAKGQVYVVRHYDVRPFVQEPYADRGLGNTERDRLADSEGNAKGFQVIADRIPDSIKGKRLVINWTIRQCNSVDVDGDGVNQGGCHSGTSYDIQYDANGNATSSAAKGQSLPGIPVSTATCVYNDNTTLSYSVKEPECTSADQSAECCQELQGDGWEFKEGKCVQKTSGGNEDGSTPKPTYLARYFSWVPQKAFDRKSADNNSSPDAFGGDKLLTVEENVSQKCGEDAGVASVQTASAKAFVEQVRTAYNAQATNETKPQLAEVGNFPTAGEFVDALNIAKSVGVNTVNGAAVCALGRAMVLTSLDHHLKKDVKRNDGSLYRNELGAFLAYIQPEAALYPAQMIDGKDECDKRFMAVSESSCQATTQLKGERRYHHNNYFWKGIDGSAYRTYKNSLSAGMKKYPLSALKLNITADCKGSAGQGACRKQYTELSKKLLVEDCENLKDILVNVQDVLDYVQGACKDGLDYKPHGAAGSGPAQQASASQLNRSGDNVVGQ